ncbi:hypothetical protein JTE90_015735 [Oedothorax gibbosus]|uniref:C2H2-type domain-containing protein n=1 Tax=Oedothorax gibbosus TaxID=931172 RepID=A0AAV6TYX1_9ARAC|nr:hypothetical protein JTE90_015735 [Oedothorax gibbosus]
MASANSGTVPLRSGDADDYRCATCGRSFASKHGLGVHRQKAHIEEYNQEISTGRIKKRWTREEVLLLVQAELLLELADPTFRDINKALSLQFPGRTHEAIKSRRRTEEFRSALSDLRSSHAAPAPGPPLRPFLPSSTPPQQPRLPASPSSVVSSTLLSGPPPGGSPSGTASDVLSSSEATIIYDIDRLLEESPSPPP